MTVRTTILQNRPQGLPAEEMRLLTATFVPVSAGGLHAFSGVLPGPAGYIGEVTLLTPETIRVNPARWVIAGTQSGTQGDYVVVNDAPVERAIGARDATLTRLDRLVVQVRDTGYTPNEGVDAPDVRVIPGTPALSGAALPAVPPNSLVLGTITVPPGSGTVTFTPTVVSYQVAVGGVLPLRLSDPRLTEPGAYDQQLRTHPIWGLQQWSTVSGTWDDLTIDRIRTMNAQDVSLTSTGHPFQLGPDNGSNLALDTNQIQSRNNNGPEWLGINVEADGNGNYGDVAIGPSAVFRGNYPDTDYRYRALEVDRLRIVGANDAQAAATGVTRSHLHGLQIGPSSGPHLIADTNEILARDSDFKLAPLFIHGLELDPPTKDAQPIRRGDLNGNSGLANQTGWQNAPLATRWGTYSGGPGAKWIYMNGSIYFSMGIISATPWPVNVLIMTWNATWKPRYDQYYSVTSSGDPWGEVKIEASSGQMIVTKAYAGTNGLLSFSGTFVPNVVF